MSYVETRTLHDVCKWAHKTIEKVGILASRSAEDPCFADFKAHLKSSLGHLERALEEFQANGEHYSAAERDTLKITAARIKQVQTVFSKITGSSAGGPKTPAPKSVSAKSVGAKSVA